MLGPVLVVLVAVHAVVAALLVVLVAVLDGGTGEDVAKGAGAVDAIEAPGSAEADGFSTEGIEHVEDGVGHKVLGEVKAIALLVVGVLLFGLDPGLGLGKMG